MAKSLDAVDGCGIRAPSPFPRKRGRDASDGSARGLHRPTDAERTPQALRGAERDSFAAGLGRLRGHSPSGE